jgi:beta-phosphoglucomutase
MLKAVLLDFNGVVINDEAIHRGLVDELLLSENLRPLTPAEYQQFCLGRSDRACLVDLFEHRGRGLTESYLQKLIERKAQQYHEKLVALENLPIYEGLQPFLEQLQLRRLAIALVTGAVRQEVEYVLERAELLSYFPVIVAGDDLQASKPQPDSYQLAIAKLDQYRLANTAADSLLADNQPLLPENCLAIEDTFAGIQAAKTAGIPVVGIAHTYPYHFMQRQANWAVDRFDELDLDRMQVIYSRRKPEMPTPGDPLST